MLDCCDLCFLHFARACILADTHWVVVYRVSLSLTQVDVTSRRNARDSELRRAQSFAKTVKLREKSRTNWGNVFSRNRTNFSRETPRNLVHISPRWLDGVSTSRDPPRSKLQRHPRVANSRETLRISDARVSGGSALADPKGSVTIYSTAIYFPQQGHLKIRVHFYARIIHS